MLPKQFGNSQGSLNPVTVCVHVSSVGVGKYSGCKTLQSSWQTSFTILETVDRPTRKEKAMVWWHASSQISETRIEKSMHSSFMRNITWKFSVLWQKINKSRFLFPTSFSLLFRVKSKTKIEEFKKFLHEVQEVPQTYDGTSHLKIRKMALESSFGVFGLYTHTSSNNLQCFR